MRGSAVFRGALKASLPMRGRLRRIKRSITPCSETPGNIAFTIRQGLQIIGCLQAQGADVTGQVLELGTGWLPIIPLLFHLAGAKHLVLTDIERLMDRRAMGVAQAKVLESLPLVASALGQTEKHLASRLSDGFEPEYLVPWNSRYHAANSIDVIYSRAVLEHVSPPVLERLFQEFRHILRPTGAMCHVIDNSDHWEHQDKTLSRVDFLRYEEGLYWKLATCDPQAYQNRLRHSDYMHLFRRHGWRTVFAQGSPDEKCLSDLKTLELAARFRGRDHRDLAVLTSVFVLRPEEA